ncbi:MAG: hypothetical protein ABIP80_03910 [Ferruginibacter sp.]
MKRTALLPVVLVMLFSASAFAQEVKVKENKVKVNDQKVKVKADEMKVKPAEVKVMPAEVKVIVDDPNKDKMGMNPYSYPATYSSNFAIGNPAYTKVILDIWDDWDHNMLDRHNYFADTLEMSFADGSEIKGLQPNMDAAKKFRGSMKSVKTTLHAMVPLKSIDRNEDVVGMWGEEENTLMDGKIEKRAFHEVWFFNKDGKIHQMLQYTAAIPK